MKNVTGAGVVVTGRECRRSAMKTAAGAGEPR